VLKRLSLFLRCCVFQGLRNGVVLHFQKRGQITVVPRGHKFPLTLRADSVDPLAFRQVFVDREYDHAMLRSVQPRQIIDAGAHIGSASVFFAKRFPKARIIAIEPDPTNFALLKQNTKFYKNIIPVNAALWSADTQVNLINGNGNSSWAFRVDAGPSSNGETGNVKAITLPTLLREFNIGTVDLLKMDVEGAEKEIFENNASDWLRRVGMLCIELHDRFRPGASRAVYSSVSQFHFIKENRGELDFLQFLHASS
jgi:FkbM family methyltransferase